LIPTIEPNDFDASTNASSLTPYSIIPRMWPTFDQLSDLSHELDFQKPLEDLPRLAPHFFVPPLENKPQNPIMDILKLEALNSNMPARSYKPLIPKELAVLSLDTSPLMKEPQGSPTRAIQELWMQAATRKLGTKVGVLSSCSSIL